MAVSYGTYTITEVQEGSQIWTTTVAPVTPNYTFTISNLTGDSETSVKAGDIIMYSYYRYTVLSVSADGTTVLAGNRVSIRGGTGASAVTYSLIVSNLAIIKDKNGNISPTSITLTAKSQTGSSAMADYAGRFKIETTTDNSTWTTQYTSSANESTKNWNVVDNIIAIRCSLYLEDGTTLLDQQTIPIISNGLDGTNGNDAYSIVLTNDNHTFAGNTTSAIASQMECNVIAYKGTTQVAATIGTITGQPTGMTTTLLNNGTTNSAFRVSVTGDMTTRNGTLNIPLTIDGKSFTKEFTYSLTLNGEPLFKVELDNYYSAIPVDSDGKTISECTVEVHFVGRKGEDPIATSLVKSSGGEYPKLFGISPQVMNSTTSYNSSMHTTMVISGYILYTIPKDTVITNDKGNISFKFNLDGASHNLEYNYCWSKVTQGKDGGRWYSGTSITGTSTTATVFSGSGISSAVEGDMYLNTSTYNTYRCTLGGDASTAKWVYVNNIKGVHGDTGKGVSSITNQYYLSTSNTAQTGGSWSNTIPSYVEDCYYWTKSHIVWTDNTETDTTAILDNGLTDANANAIDARKVATNYLAVDNTGIMVADMQDDEQTPSTATGKNVFIDNDSVDIRNGQTVLSSFGNGIVTLGEADKARLELTTGSIKGISNQGVVNFDITGQNIDGDGTLSDSGVLVNQATDEDRENGILFKATFRPNLNLNNYDSLTGSINFIFNNNERTYNFSYDVPDTEPWAIVIPYEEVVASRAHYKYGVDMLGSYYTFTFVDLGSQSDIIVDDTVSYNISITSTDYHDSSFSFGSRATSLVDDYSIGSNSCVIGEELVATSANQVAIGRYNYDNTERYPNELNRRYAFMVGNGFLGAGRNNAFAVDWNGRVETGDVKATGLLLEENSKSEMDDYIKCVSAGDADIFKVNKNGIINAAGRINAPNANFVKSSSNNADYIQCGDTDNNVNFQVLHDGSVIVGNDLLVGNSQTVTNNLTVGGNGTVTGGLTVNGSGGIVSKGGISVTGNAKVSGRLLDTSSNPLFKVVTVTVDNLTIAYNNGVYPNVAVNATGYTPVAIGSYQISNSTNHTSSYAAWTWALMEYHLLSNGRIYCYVGNWHSSAALRVKLTFTVLCIKSTAL